MRNDQIFVLLLVVLLPLSGCFDGNGLGEAEGADDSDTSSETTIVNNYYNNSTTIIQQTPPVNCFQNGVFPYSAEYNKGSFQSIGGGVSTWVGTPVNYVEVLTLNQRINESLEVQTPVIWADTNYSDCSNHSQENRCSSNSGIPVVTEYATSGQGYDYYWLVNCAQGLSFETSSLSSNFAGSECSFSLYWASQYHADNVYWNIEYSVMNVVEGPHF